jgi:hypothetical protein
VHYTRTHLQYHVRRSNPGPIDGLQYYIVRVYRIIIFRNGDECAVITAHQQQQQQQQQQQRQQSIGGTNKQKKKKKQQIKTGKNGTFVRPGPTDFRSTRHHYA